MTRKGWLLIAACALIVALPILLVAVLPADKVSQGLFTGTDQQATATITQLAPDYRPWVNPLWRPPSAEIESLLFALQAALGAGVLGFCLGLGRRRGSRPEDASPPDTGRRCD